MEGAHNLLLFLILLIKYSLACTAQCSSNPSIQVLQYYKVQIVLICLVELCAFWLCNVQCVTHMKVGQWLGSEVDKNPKSLKSFSVVHLEQFRSASNFGIGLENRQRWASKKRVKKIQDLLLMA